MSLAPEFGPVPDEPEQDASSSDTLALTFTPVAEFAARVEEDAEPLLGTRQESIVAAGSDVVLYGDGGAAKTTLSVDLVAHLASGTSWLGFDVLREIRVLVIENEGPRGKFREKLAHKLSTWTGTSWRENVEVLEDPWGRFSLRSPEHRGALARRIADRDADLIVLGPVKRLGMIGGGTPDEVSSFTALLTEVRALLDRPISFWLVHHENKSGEVSGAWEGETDTLLHIKPQGKERSVLEFEKARWAPTAHGGKLTLRWLVESAGFAVVADEVERDYRAEVIAAMSDGEWWSKTRLKKPKDEGGIGAAPENIQAVFDAEPELFEKATGKQLGKSKGTYYRLKGSEHESPMLTLATLATHPEEGESEHHASRLEESDAVLSHSPWPPSGDARSRDSLDGGGSRPDDIDFGGTTRDVKD